MTPSLENQSVNPIVVDMQPVAGKELGHKEETAIHRSNRYTQAEQALTYCFQRSLEQEMSTSQLQIVVLRKATYLLHIHISETADSLERLRSVLVDRSLEPREYEYIQRQRWLEERRLLEAEDLSKALQRSLTTPSTSAQSQAIPSVSSNAKANANLLRFLDRPWSRASSNGHNYCRYLRKGNASGRNGIPRIHKHNSLLPLTLPSQRCRAPRALLTLLPLPRPLPSSFEISESTCHSSSSLTPSSIFDSPSTPEATPLPELMFPIPTSLLSLPPSTDATGTATIWQQTISFSREEILKGLVVSMPDYVNDLLAEFDSAIPADPHLPLEKLDTFMTSRTESNDRLPIQSERASLSSGIDYHSIPRRQDTPPPPMRRHSVFFDVVTSHMSIPSGDGQMNSREARRRSSPPSAFPTTLTRATIASNGPSRRSTTRRTSISISDLRSVFSGSASSNGQIATSTPRHSETAPNPPEQQQQRASTDKKLLTRLRHRMSFLRRS